MIRKLKFVVMLVLIGWTAYAVAERCYTHCYWVGGQQYCTTTCQDN